MVRKQVAKHYDTPKLPGYGNFSIFYFFFYESWHGPEANSQSLALWHAQAARNLFYFIFYLFIILQKNAIVRKQVAEHYHTQKLPGYGNFFFFKSSLLCHSVVEPRNLPLPFCSSTGEREARGRGRHREVLCHAVVAPRNAQAARLRHRFFVFFSSFLKKKQKEKSVHRYGIFFPQKSSAHLHGIISQKSSIHWLSEVNIQGQNYIYIYCAPTWGKYTRTRTLLHNPRTLLHSRRTVLHNTLSSLVFVNPN